MILKQLTFTGIDPLMDQTITFYDETVSKRVPNKGWANVLIGENGTGKSRIISSLSSLFGNSTDASKRGISERAQYYAICQTDESNVVFVKTPRDQNALVAKATADHIANITKFHLSDPRFRERITNLPLGWSPRPKVEEFFVSGSSGSIKVSDSKVGLMQPVKLEKRSELDLTFDPSQQVSQSILNILLSASLESLEEEDAEVSQRSRNVRQQLERALSLVAGRPVKFQIEMRPELSLKVRFAGSKISFSQLPDGLRSILAWLVACVGRICEAYPEEENPLLIPQILLLDEPETHLHPAWQRQIIPATQGLLPNCQIIVATHSPFVLSSINQGLRHLFVREDQGVMVKTAPCSAGDSYIEAATELGVTEWYDPETESMLKNFREAKDYYLKTFNDVKPLIELAEQIGARSSSLENMMARELSQIQKIASARSNDA